MKWIVGLDLRPSCEGALQFARWLSRISRADGERVLAVHVIEEEPLRAALRVHHMDEVLRIARERAERILREGGAPELASTLTLEVVPALRAEETLVEVLRREAADAFVVGRLATCGSHRLVRLGRVARRLLKRLAAPVIVVPPDLRERDLGDGPLVMATDLTDASVEACRFAQLLGHRLARSVTLVTVAADPKDAAPYGLPDDQVEALRREALEAGEIELRAWIEANDLLVGATVALVGDRIETVIELATRLRSPLVVAGSHRRAGADRLLVPSSARELAAAATVPVAVVPPRD